MSNVPTVEQAALNNAAWCNAVCATHDGPGSLDPAAWSTTHPTPPYYPNMVTLASGAVAEQLQRANEIVAAIGLDHDVGIKDSFSRLDLSPRGFVPIIHAEWYALTKPMAGDSTAPVESVSNDATLIEWESAWSATSSNDIRIFKSELLALDTVVFLTERVNDRIQAGLIANLSAGVLGISNLFAPPGRSRAFVLGAVGVLRERFGDRPMVGYAGGAELQFMLSLGFEPLGALKVWVRSAGSNQTFG